MSYHISLTANYYPPWKIMFDYDDDIDYDDDYDPTPQYLYDDTNGEPPISWQERRDAEFRKKYGWA